MKTYVIDNGSTYISELMTSLKERKAVLISYDSLDHTKINDQDLVILSGGHGFPVLWHDEEYKNEINIIKHHRGPIIGICLGFELISHVFGSHLHQLKERRKGAITISPAIKNSIVTEDRDFSVFVNHNWSVEKLQKPLVALAYSSDGVEVMRHTSRPIYGMQFHPEVNIGNGNVILENIFKDINNS
jgi:GMP synthase (glutamine-hydrolysing)